MAYEQDIKEKVKERYGKIALSGNTDSYCMPGECCQVDDNDNNNRFTSSIESTKMIGYDINELYSIPQSSILGAGCGAPTKFAFIKEGDAVVDLGFWSWHRSFSGCKKNR
jgi:arsenite methyltransferase